MNPLHRIFRIFLFALGALLILNIIFLQFIMIINSGMIITFIFGVFCIVLAIFYKRLSNIGLKYLIYIGFSFMITMITFLSAYGNHDTVNYHEDAVLVLGAGIVDETVTSPLAYRLDKCVEYYKKNPNALIVVSGGKGPHESVSEASAMERYLIQKGIPQEKILKEERSENTYENFKYSKILLDETLLKPYKIAIITNHFHIYRAVCLSKIAGFSDSTHLHAGLDWYNLSVNYIREVCGVLKLWVLRQ